MVCVAISPGLALIGVKIDASSLKSAPFHALLPSRIAQIHEV